MAKSKSPKDEGAEDVFSLCTMIRGGMNRCRMMTTAQNPMNRGHCLRVYSNRS